MFREVGLPILLLCGVFAVAVWARSVAEDLRSRPKRPVNWDRVWWGLMCAFAAMAMMPMPYPPQELQSDDGLPGQDEID